MELIDEEGYQEDLEKFQKDWDKLGEKHAFLEEMTLTIGSQLGMIVKYEDGEAEKKVWTFTVPQRVHGFLDECDVYEYLRAAGWNDAQVEVTGTFQDEMHVFIVYFEE